MCIPEPAGGVIRFHPACPFEDARTGAMFALVRDIATDASVASHRTTLDHGGAKARINGKAPGSRTA